jgi:fumarate reductase flavoprotein subunit
MEMGRGKNMLKSLPHYPTNLPPVVEWADSLDHLHRDQEELVCEDCHETMPPIGQPPEENCIACHGETVQGLFELTARFEPNPHDGHEGAGACSLCHPNFGPEIEPCALCHEDIAYSLIDGNE